MYTKNDIFVFYEIINDIKPQKVLDVGMFLKCVGSVSRKIMDKKIDESIWMEGVDFMPEIQFPVFQRIYNETISLPFFLQQSHKQEKYDLGILLKNKESNPDNKKEIVEKMTEMCHYILTNECEISGYCKKEIEDTIAVKVENGEYYIFILKDKNLR